MASVKETNKQIIRALGFARQAIRNCWVYEDGSGEYWYRRQAGEPWLNVPRHADQDSEWQWFITALAIMEMCEELGRGPEVDAGKDATRPWHPRVLVLAS